MKPLSPSCSARPIPGLTSNSPLLPIFQHWSLLGNHFHEGAIGQIAGEQTHHSSFDQAAQHRRRRGWGRQASDWGSFSRAAILSHAAIVFSRSAIHGEIGQSVGMTILLAQHMPNLKLLERENAAPGLLMQRTKLRDY